jgi:hypothetical protein
MTLIWSNPCFIDQTQIIDQMVDLLVKPGFGEWIGTGR